VYVRPHRLAGDLVQDPHVIARHGKAGRSCLGREVLEASEVAGDGPAGLGLPPVVYHRLAQQLCSPVVGVGVEALARQEKSFKVGEIVCLQILSVGIFALDRSECCRRGEESLHLVLRYHPPESARVRGAHRLSFVHDRGSALQQGPIDDVGMTHHPAHVRGGPEDISSIDAVDVFHRPVQRHRVASVVPHDALGHAGGARGVEDVEGVCGFHRHARGGLRFLFQFRPVEIARRQEV
jgi:hypothetical protein